MRNNGTRGYQGYRGRRPNGKRWLILVLALILIVAAAFLAVQRYMVYEKDGSYYFELPWFHRGDGTQPVARHGSKQNLEIIIEEPTPAQVAQKVLHARELDASTLQGGMSRALGALDENTNAVAIRLKTVDGDLLYPSALPAAVEAKAIAGSSIARSALAELADSDYYTIARLSALHDSRFSFAHMTDAAILQTAYKNYVWYAPDSSFYLAPEKELTRQYLSDIAREVAALGFDELLFDEFGYPTTGRLNNIKTSDRGMTQEEALALLAANLREAVSDYDVKLSLTMDAETVLSGANAKSGQKLSVLAPLFDRIYVPAVPEDVPALQAALAPYSAELVPILETAPAAGAYLLTQ